MLYFGLLREICNSSDSSGITVTSGVINDNFHFVVEPQLWNLAFRCKADSLMSSLIWRCSLGLRTSAMMIDDIDIKGL